MSPSVTPDPSQLPALLRLVDDPSEAVRGPVLEALAAFGDELEESLRALDQAPDEQRLAQVLGWVAGHRGAVEATADGVPAEPSPARYQVGQLVRHRRYGYRGVVVAFDSSCQADEQWYQGNRTQPSRDQPWYHVLVHGSDAITYAAESNLLPDESCDPVDHPCVELFFRDFDDGRYVRNQRPWMAGG